jgi:hypothetical protein
MTKVKILSKIFLQFKAGEMSFCLKKTNKSFIVMAIMGATLKSNKDWKRLHVYLHYESGLKELLFYHHTKYGPDGYKAAVDLALDHCKRNYLCPEDSFLVPSYEDFLRKIRR